MPNKFKYSESNFITDDNFLDSKFHYMLRSEPNKSVYIIPLDQQYRIDLITQALYGDSRMAWVLNAMNHILHIEELAHGKELKYLPKSTIDELYTKWRHGKND